MALSETGKKLMEKLKSISYDKDFVCGTMSIANSDEAWQKMIDFIDMSEKMGEPATWDDMMGLALILAREMGLDQ